MHISPAPQDSLANKVLQGHQDRKEVKEFLGHLDLLDSQAPGDQWDLWAHLQIYLTLSRADVAPWAHLEHQGEMAARGSEVHQDQKGYLAHQVHSTSYC